MDIQIFRQWPLAPLISRCIVGHVITLIFSTLLYISKTIGQESPTSDHLLFTTKTPNGRSLPETRTRDGLVFDTSYHPSELRLAPSGLHMVLFFTNLIQIIWDRFGYNLTWELSRTPLWIQIYFQTCRPQGKKSLHIWLVVEVCALPSKTAKKHEHYK